VPSVVSPLSTVKNVVEEACDDDASYRSFVVLTRETRKRRRALRTALQRNKKRAPAPSPPPPSLLFAPLIPSHQLLLQPERALEHVAHPVPVVDVGQRVLAQAVPQAQRRHPVDVLEGDAVAPLKGGERLAGAVGDDVAADAVDVELGADLLFAFWLVWFVVVGFAG